MSKIPKHIAFIMDGNGRWAANRKHVRTHGHRAGVDTLIDVLDYAYNKGVYAVSVFAFSTENWQRPKREVQAIFRILREYLASTSHRLLEQDVRFCVMGDISPLPMSLQKEITSLIEATAHCVSHVFNMGLNYGGRDEIVRAVNTLIEKGCTHVTEQDIAAALDTASLPDPDLIVRTAGEQRLSNFMLYQAAYAELYYTPIYWPDFNSAALDDALSWYESRNRKFGKISLGEQDIER